MFKKINFEINDEELNFFFRHKNINCEEGYILTKIFFETNSNIEWRENTIVENEVTTETQQIETNKLLC